MLGDPFELYYYSDPKLKEVSQHSHDHFEFYLFLEGDVEMQIGSACRILNPGDVIILPPGIFHHAFSCGEGKPYRRFVLWLGNELLDELFKESDSYRDLFDRSLEGHYYHHLEAGHFQEIQTKAITILEELHSDHFGKETFLKLYLSDLILSLTRYSYESEQLMLSSSDGTFHELLSYIDAHLSEELTLDGIAAHFYVSKSHIIHLFKAEMGLSLHQYVIKKRLGKCRDAIISGRSISETFLSYGFNDYSNFFKAFKKEFGISPREYRDMHLPVTRRQFILPS